MSLNNDLFENITKILYYDVNELKKSLKILQFKPTKEIARQFIKNYFDAGSKEKVFVMDFQQKYLIKGKHLHTVSLFLLGCHLSKLVDIPLENHFLDRIKSVDWYEFTYTWFLTSLYHDASFVLEDESLQVGTCEQFKTLNYNISKNCIEYEVFRYMSKNVNCSSCGANSCIKSMNNSYFTFPESLVRDYFFYRADYMNTIDHGIIAGYIMFDRLIKNYEQAWMAKCKEGDNYNYESFYHKNLNWRIEHQAHFACIANAIIAHNIWYCSYTDENNYRRYELGPLFSSTAEKISLNKWPLVFYLGLLDTIEPVKRFESKMDTIEVWKQFEINVLHGNVLIEIGEGLKAECEDEYKKWIDAIYSMPDWLMVRLEPEIKDQVMSKIRIIPFEVNN